MKLRRFGGRIVANFGADAQLNASAGKSSRGSTAAWPAFMTMMLPNKATTSRSVMKSP
jgi:hypothetical protein